MKDKESEDKRKKKKVSRRVFATTSMAVAAVPALVGCEDTKTNKAETASVTPDVSSRLGMSGGSSGNWKEGTTIPAEYYVDAKHFENDERYLAENLWLMVDHASRIPEVGDFFTFEFGRGENIIILRDDKKNARAFHNVCRHRSSRLCRASDAPKPEGVSILQLESSGNTPVFRCPYHGWTYDLQGSLTKAHMMPQDFDLSQNGYPMPSRGS